MALTSELDQRLKAAMKAGDRRVVDVVRMVKAKLTEARTAPGFRGELTDEVVLEVIGSYVKQLKKALVEYEKAGERGAEGAEGLRFEIAYLEPMLPAKLDEEATRALVEQAIAETGVNTVKQAGRVIGAVMKDHRAEVEPVLVKKIAMELLPSD